MDLNVYFSCHSDSHFKEKYRVLGLDYLQAWEKGRVLKGQKLMEVSVFEFVEEKIIKAGIPVQFAHVKIMEQLVENNHEQYEAVEVVLPKQSNEERGSLSGRCTISRIIELLNIREGMIDKQAVLNRIKELGLNRKKSKHFKVEDSVFSSRVPFGDVFFSGYDIGWDFCLESVNGHNRLLFYKEKLGLEDLNCSQAQLEFESLVLKKSDKQIRSFAFSYFWVWDEYLESSKDAAKLEKFILKYARLLCMTPRYVGPGLLDYIMVESTLGRTLTVYEFFSIPIIVNQILGHYVYNVGGGSLEELICYLDGLVDEGVDMSIFKNTLIGVFSPLIEIGVKSLFLNNLYVQENSLLNFGSGQFLNFMHRSLFFLLSGSFECYYFRLLKLSLDNDRMSDKLNISDRILSEDGYITEKESQGHTVNDDVIGYDFRHRWAAAIYQDGNFYHENLPQKYKDDNAIIGASVEARTSLLVDESLSFISMIVKRNILENWRGAGLFDIEFSEYRDPGGSLISLVSKEEYLLSCFKYVSGLVRRGLLNFEDLSRSQLSVIEVQMSFFWDRTCLCYFGNVSLDLG
jgi:hypothetical protein